MGIQAQGGTTIARSIDAVFDYLANPRNEPDWLPGATTVEKTNDEPIGRGSTFVGHYDRAGRVELELVEFDRPHKVTFRAHSKIVDFDDAVELTETATGTRLQANMTATPRGPMRFVAALMGKTMRRQFTANWEHLKRKLETTRPSDSHTADRI